MVLCAYDQSLERLLRQEIELDCQLSENAGLKQSGTWYIITPLTLHYKTQVANEKVAV